MTNIPNLEVRLARVEQVMQALSREITAIRAELGRAESTNETSPIDAVPASEASPTPRPQSSRNSNSARSLDIERLLGRYGMLGIAVFAAVAAVGTFLSWAISKGYLTLGPAARVILGLLFAAAIGAWGLKLRKKERSFGSSLLGLALVIVLVCAYAAGPHFQLVPTIGAFIGAAGITWGLAMFARVQNDEPLWCVAFGGAAIAPFVTSDGTGTVYALLAYGLVLLVFGCFGVGGRDWPIAWRVFYLASALLSISVGQLAENHATLVSVLAALGFPLAAGAIGVVPFAPDERKRATLRWLALLAVIAAFDVAHQYFLSGVPLFGLRAQWVVSGAILLMIAIWLTIVDRSAEVAQSSILARNANSVALLHWLDVAFIPILLSFRAADVAPLGYSKFAYVIAALLLLVFLWRRPIGVMRDAAAFAFMFAAAMTVFALPRDTATVRILGLLALGLVALGSHRAKPSWSWVWTGAVVLLLAMGFSADFLSDRVAYALPPFTTMPSFAALCVTLALAVIAGFWRWIYDSCRAAMVGRSPRAYVTALQRILRTAVAAPWVWAFVWIYIELTMAYSPSTSMLLLVIYFAMTGVACVAVGRSRNSALLRRLGLMLAIVAAGTSAYGASRYFNSGIRIIAYLVTSAFLLGIAFWYRRTTPPTAEA